MAIKNIKNICILYSILSVHVTIIYKCPLTKSKLQQIYPTDKSGI